MGGGSETKFPKVEEGTKRAGNQDFLKKLEEGTYLGGQCAKIWCLVVAEFISRTKERTGTDIMNKKEKHHRFTEPVIVILQLKWKKIQRFIAD